MLYFKKGDIKMKFKYGNKVKVITGFYEGLKGSYRILMIEMANIILLPKVMFKHGFWNLF